MAAKKEGSKSTAKKSTSAKSTGTKKSKSSGIMDKVKDAAGEILSNVGRAAAVGALNVAAEAVSDMLSGDKKKAEKVLR